jgi:hypothetical protein
MEDFDLAAGDPNEGHGFVKRETKNDELKRAAAWFEHHLHGKPLPANQGD